MKILIDDVPNKLGNDPYFFLCFSSFEGRSTSITSVLNVSNISRSFVFESINTSSSQESNTNVLLKKLELAETIKINFNNPIEALDVYESIVHEHLVDNDIKIVIDITTFSHEQLLIFFKVLNEYQLLNRVTVVYTGADKYSYNEKEDDLWLSRGVSSIRSVLGYSGEMLPTRTLHLMILVGFESRRARCVIEQYEPALLSLGVGSKQNSVTPEHYETNRHFFERVSHFTDSVSTISPDHIQFEFSCVNPFETKNKILEQLKNSPNHNVVVCPLNTKLSTIGVALAAFENDSIQICYPQAIEYNTEGYSEASKECRIFSLSA